MYLSLRISNYGEYMITRSPTLTKEHALILLNGFLNQFLMICNRSKTVSTGDFEKFLSPKFQITSNGKLVGKSLVDYASRVTNFKKRYSRVEISKRLEEPIFSNNKAVIYYQAVLTSQTGQKSEISVISIATIENDKISQWLQVMHEKGSGNWDS